MQLIYFSTINMEKMKNCLGILDKISWHSGQLTNIINKYILIENVPMLHYTPLHMQ